MDTPLSESRFADILEGWVGEEREHDDNHDVLKHLDELDDHGDEPFSEEEDQDDEDHEEDDVETAIDDDHDDNEEEDNEDEGIVQALIFILTFQEVVN